MIHKRTLQALEFPGVVRLLASHCLTPQGRTRAEELSPLPSEPDAVWAMQLYEDARLFREDREASRLFCLRQVPDVSPLLRALESSHSVADTDSLWALKSVLTLSSQAFAAIHSGNGLKWPRLLALAERLPLPVQLTHALNRCISDDALLRDESSPELYRLRTEIRNLHQSCLKKVHDFASRYNILPYLQEEFMTISQDRYVLPLKATYKARLQGILHDWSQTGETCYFEPMFLVELNNRLQELRREEREEELKVLLYLTDLLRSEVINVKNALELVTELDLLEAKAKLALDLEASCVNFVPEEEGLSLFKARHPLLVAQEQKDSRGLHPVQPLDLVLRPGDHCLLVTGGNAGGKTVCLKTLGLIYVMAASGLPAPVAPGSSLFWLERLDAFIGDEQNIEDHVSTFTAQIRHLSRAWKYLKGRSLVLLDEFGAGTDPTHGAALAQAVLDSLLEREAYIFCATHFPTLKIWALSSAGVRAASMLFDPQSRRPLYRLAYDQVGQSQTLVVAREHGLPEEILERAEKILLLGGGDSSRLLDRLNELALEREKEIATLRSLEKKTKDEAEKLKERLKKEQARLVDEVGKNIHDLIGAWKAGKIQAKQAMNELRRERAKLLEKGEVESLKKKEEQFLEPEALVRGMRIRHRSLDKWGVITDIDLRKKRIRLDLGGISLWAEMTEIAAVENEKTSLRLQPVHTNVSGGFSAQLDVRGMTADQARAALERFLDKSLLTGLSSVEVIHGRGTGVLRRELHDYLAAYPGIEHYQLAPEDQGGDGKTIISFR